MTDADWESFEDDKQEDQPEEKTQLRKVKKNRRNVGFSQMMGKKISRKNVNDYGILNIDESTERSPDEIERLKKDIQKERKVAFNAYTLLKIEMESIGDFFFGTKKVKIVKKKFAGGLKGKIGESAEEGSYDSYEEDFSLSSSYQSNTRQELQNHLRNINFEDEGEPGQGSPDKVDLFLKSLTDEPDSQNKRSHIKNSKKLNEIVQKDNTEEDMPEVEAKSETKGSEEETGESNKLVEGKKVSSEQDNLEIELFSSGNAQDLDLEMILTSGAYQEDSQIKEIQMKSKMDIASHHDLEEEDIDLDNDDDDDLVNGGMDIKYDLLEEDEDEEEELKIDAYKTEKDPKSSEPDKDITNLTDEEFFGNLIEGVCGPEETEEPKEEFSGDKGGVRLGGKRRKKRKEREAEAREMDQFLDQIAKMEKSEDIPSDENNSIEEEEQSSKRDIYIQQRDQYFVDDEEVYLNELETGNCNWKYIKDLFRVVTHPEEEKINLDDENRETVLNYFADICKGLLNSRSEDFLVFVYSNSEVVDALFRFVEYEGVNAIIEGVLNIRDSVYNLNSFRFLKHRFGLYRRLLKEIMKSTSEVQISQMAKIFVKLIKDKSEVIDANYFIDKILLENENHVALLDKVLKEKNEVLAEVVSLIIQRVVPEEEKNFLEDTSKDDINKSFGKGSYSSIFNLERLNFVVILLALLDLIIQAVYSKLQNINKYINDISSQSLPYKFIYTVINDI